MRDCLIMHWSCTFRLGLFLNHQGSSGVKYTQTQQQDKTGISHLSLRVETSTFYLLQFLTLCVLPMDRAQQRSGTLFRVQWLCNDAFTHTELVMKWQGHRGKKVLLVRIWKLYLDLFERNDNCNNGDDTDYYYDDRAMGHLSAQIK